MIENRHLRARGGDAMPPHPEGNKFHRRGEREKERETRWGRWWEMGQIFTTNFFHDNCADLVYQSGYAGPSSDPIGNPCWEIATRKISLFFLCHHSCMPLLSESNKTGIKRWKIKWKVNNVSTVSIIELVKCKYTSLSSDLMQFNVYVYIMNPRI